MKLGDVVADARLAKVRELRAALAGANARAVAAEARAAAMEAHFPLALAALKDLEGLGPGENLTVVDGWNLTLRHRNVSSLSTENVAELRGKVAERCRRLASSGGAVWLVYDGAKAGSSVEGRLRVSYTGGEGAHRADRLMLDYVRAVNLLGLDSSKVKVVTGDRDLADSLRRQLPPENVMEDLPS